MSESAAFAIATILAAAFGAPAWAVVLLTVLTVLTVFAELRKARR